MDELKKELNEVELDEVAGGKSKKPKPQKTKNKCLQCMIKGRMNESIYLVDSNITFCTTMCHIYKNNMYLYMDEKAVKDYMSR